MWICCALPINIEKVSALRRLEKEKNIQILYCLHIPFRHSIRQLLFSLPLLWFNRWLLRPTLRLELRNYVWSKHLLKCFVCLNHSVACPTWLAMEWCWLQTGWQGLQGGQDHTVTETTVDFLLKTFPLTVSDSTSAADLPPPVSLLPDNPYLLFSSWPFP